MPKMPVNTSPFESDEEESVQPETQTFNTEDMRTFSPGRHTWRQQGPYLVCRACELHHAIYIGMDKIMIGEDAEGRPEVRDKVSI